MPTPLYYATRTIEIGARLPVFSHYVPVWDCNCSTPKHPTGGSLPCTPCSRAIVTEKASHQWYWPCFTMPLYHDATATTGDSAEWPSLALPSTPTTTFANS